MRKAINWLGGTVTLEAEGPFIERWFNICAAAGLGFWDVRMQGEHTARITLSRWAVEDARRLAEQAGCTVSVVRQSGLPPFLLQFRRRYGMILGAALVILLFTVLNRFILVIEVEGNETLPDSAILAGLQNHGFRVGSYGPGVDVRDLSNEMLLDMEELSFLTVNINGIRAKVIVRETAPVPEIADENALADVAAARDGVVLDMNVIAGQEAVQPGQAVLKGEVLISSLLINERADGSGQIISTQQVRARGEVWAATERTLSASTPLTVLRPDPKSGSSRRYSLALMGNRINFYGNSSQWDKECDKIAILYPVTLPSGETLPFGLWQTTWQQWGQTPAPVNPDSACQFLRGVLLRRLETALGDGRILSAQWSTQQTDGAVTVTLTAQCMEQIGVTVELGEQN